MGNAFLPQDQPGRLRESGHEVKGGLTLPAIMAAPKRLAVYGGQTGVIGRAISAPIGKAGRKPSRIYAVHHLRPPAAGRHAESSSRKRRRKSKCAAPHAAISS